MSKYRIAFSKKDTAKYISHLDLMRTMQRVFIRGGLKIAHTQGFNPHPYMVFAIPLSVGCESECELMDFELTDDVPMEEIPVRLNKTMPSGITVLKAFASDTKFKDIVWLSVEGFFEYADNISDDKIAALDEFLNKDSLIITRKTKKGLGEADIAPNIYSIKAERAGENTVKISTVIAAQNPSLNPEHLVSAIQQLMPELMPEHHLFKRTAFLDKELHIFN